MRRALGIVVLAIAATAIVPAAAQDARLGFPRELRAALIGCWDLGDGETVRLEARGEHGLRALHRVVPGARGGPRTYSDTAFYLPESGALQMECGARTQHGQWCEVRVRDDGALDVAVIARGHGRGHAHLARTLIATRCAGGAGARER